ncbi:hypothetical protein BDEG_23591 [Batrachochytrium dendrobatidis JEL423]|uniref:Uncharacterized protein n=1 Tax=Batrachochytrium dendrobatidis (strain JEL423) TaxID=403673 RepID=A0A177WI27_BATDL|nr:hypothetical protein BDEG_23591 [Batrachochytrium dendrobatidis JEL423]
MTTDNPFSYPSVIFTPILKGLTDTAIVFQYVVLGDDAEKSRKHHIETSVSPSLLWTSRLFFGGIAAGFVSGAGLQGHIRSRQFLAENAHRLPRTVGGWYFYHRHKQLAIISGAGVGGVYYAARFGLLSAMFGVAEHAIGEWVTGKDIFVNALGAGLFTAAAFSRIGKCSEV